MTIEPLFDCPDSSDPFDQDDRTPLEFDDEPWDAFLPDDDQREPLPESGDFWIESDQLTQPMPAA